MVYYKRTLSNGLRVITVPMPSFSSITVLLLVGVGSRYEEKDINGLSHFLEHMAFKGTTKRPSALAIASEIDGIGGEFNAFTSKDHTGYYIKAASHHFPLVVDMLSDMLLHSKLDEKEIEKEKGVIIEELNMYEDTPIKKIGDLYENLLYGNTKLGRDIIGRKEVIRQVKREDFVKYLERFYSPTNTVIVVAGGLDNEKIKNKKEKLSPQMRDPTEAGHLKIEKLIEEYLGSWSVKDVEAPQMVDDIQEKPAVLVKFKDTQQAHLCLGVRSYNLFHHDRYALSVLTAILGGGMSSRLFTEVREKRGLAYYVRSQSELYTDVGNFVTQAGVDVLRIDDAIAVMLDVFGQITAEKVKEKELLKAKEYMKGRLILDVEDSRNVAGLIATSELFEEKVKTVDDIIKEIDRVTVNDVQRVAKDIFTERKLNLAVIGPFKEEERFNRLLKV